MSNILLNSNVADIALPTDLATSQQLNRDLLTLVVALQARVKQLESELVAIKERLNDSSVNSSSPPSRDTPEQRAQRERKPKSGLKRGGQPGHPKHERALVDESRLDGIQHYYPNNRCSCGGSLLMHATPHRRHQVFDLPEVRYQVTEHRLYAGVCICCGQRQVAQLPRDVPQGQMGAGLISWITVMNGACRLSVRQIQSLLEEQWQLTFSSGAVSEATEPVSRWLQPLYAQVGDAVRASPLIHADETTHYRKAERRWLWVLCSPQVVYFMTHTSRGKAAADALLGSCSGVLVTDQHGGYNNYPKERRQLCWAHLIRKFKKMAQRYGDAGKLGKRLLRLGRLMIHCHNRWKSGRYQDALYRHRIERFKQAIHQTLEVGGRWRQVQSGKPTQTANQCLRLLDDEPMLWTFTHYPGVPLTNNEAERAIRPYVIWRKTSFFSQSFRGDQFRPLILTIVETCKRLGVSAYRIIRQVCQQGLAGEKVTVRLPIAQPVLMAA